MVEQARRGAVTFSNAHTVLRENRHDAQFWKLAVRALQCIPAFGNPLVDNYEWLIAEEEKAAAEHGFGDGDPYRELGRLESEVERLRRRVQELEADYDDDDEPAPRHQPTGEKVIRGPWPEPPPDLSA